MNTFDGRETANAPPADDIAAVNVPRLPAKMIGRGIEAAGTSVSREYYGNNSDNIPHLSPPNYETYHDKHGGAMKAHTKPPSMPYGDYVLAYNKDGVGKAAGSIGRSSNMHDNRTHAQTNRSSNQDWIVESLLDLKKISPGGYDDSTRSSGKAHAGTKRNGGHTGVADGSITRKLPFIDDIPDKYLPANVAKKQDIWNQRLTELIQFKKLHGHTNVPQKYENNTSLGAWVARNRIFMRQWEESPSSCSAYQAERVKILKKAGLLSNIGKGGYTKSTGVFMSRKSSRDWEKQFNSLKEYKSIYGNCDVPVKTKQYKSLGRWVSAQRKKYRQHVSGNAAECNPGNELVQRFQRLREINFNFVIGSGNAKKRNSNAQSTDSVPDQSNSKDDKTGVNRRTIC